MKTKDLQANQLYGDKDGVNMYYYVGKYGAGNLSEFKKADYDDEKQDFFPTNERIILTPDEVEKIKQW